MSDTNEAPCNSQSDFDEQNNSEASKEAMLLSACYAGDVDRARELVKQGAEIFVTDEVGRTALHFAAASGSVDTVKFVLESGIPWNALDEGDFTAGDYAESEDHKEAYAELVNAGIRAEMVLRLLNQESTLDKAANEDYLSQPVEYSGDKLIDAEKNGVMMSWEAPLMELHAKTIGSKPNSVVLNIGFGMGIIDNALQELSPAKHVIVEAHPDVYQHMKDEGWDKKSNVHIVFGRWQDKLDEIRQLGPYDGIFFDTFGEFYKDLDDFHKAIFVASSGQQPLLRRPDGVYSFFNGLGGDHKLFNDVYCDIVQSDLLKLGIKTEYSQVASDIVMDKETWKGVKRPYWMVKTYHLPTSSRTSSDWQDRPSVLQCGHVFHQGCISAWLAQCNNGTCPTCRTSHRGDMIPLYFGIETEGRNGENAVNEEATDIQIKHRNNIIKTLCTNIQAAQEETKQAKDELAAAKKRHADLESQVAQEKTKHTEIKAKAMAYKKTALDLTTESRKLKNTIAQHSLKMEEQRHRISSLERELEEQRRIVTSMGDVRSTNEQLARSLKKERSKNDTLASLNTQLANRVSSLGAEISELKSRLSSKEAPLPTHSSSATEVDDSNIVDLISEASIEVDQHNDIEGSGSSIVSPAKSSVLPKPLRKPGPTFGVSLRDLEAHGLSSNGSSAESRNSIGFGLKSRQSINPFAITDKPFAEMIPKDIQFTQGLVPSNSSSHRLKPSSTMYWQTQFTSKPNGLGGSRQNTTSRKNAIQARITWGSKR
ncbi:hypothetical protein IWW36_000725 [Coemansia brasiliensis]|uniref:Type IV protein arginine N-methyltransferase n=1 Tax=Coemansia brasiliensis TaxID=2650707 RepID=A0A9W8M2P9_9FUNG|nr:hypothetical protein IWW36_000725 [Coemansia brasiliensis]